MAEETRKIETTEPLRFRYRFRFSKAAALRWIGHLDLQTTWERTLKRAKAPLYYTQGFHPRPKMVFASALPVGCSSEAELVDIWMNQLIDSDKLKDELNKTAPPGLEVYEVKLIDLREKAITTQVKAALYLIKLPLTVSDIDEHVKALLAEQSIMRERRNKTYDLRPLIHQLEFKSEEKTLAATLQIKEGATGRIEEVLDALNLDPAECKIHRKELIF